MGLTDSLLISENHKFDLKLPKQKILKYKANEAKFCIQ